MTTKTARFNLMIPEKYLNYARRLAKERGSTVSQLMRDALVSYMRDEAARLVKDREDRTQAAL